MRGWSEGRSRSGLVPPWMKWLCGLIRNTQTSSKMARSRAIIYGDSFTFTRLSLSWHRTSQTIQAAVLLAPITSLAQHQRHLLGMLLVPSHTKFRKKWNYLRKGSSQNTAPGKLSPPQMTISKRTRFQIVIYWIKVPFLLSFVSYYVNSQFYFIFISRDWKVDPHITF